MNQIKRRPNPLETPEKQSEPVFNRPTKEFEVKAPLYEQRNPAVEQHQQNVAAPNVSNRDKYTSTMDPALRKRIKIACAMRGIMFAQFVEEACREKLTKEGMM